MALTPLSQCFPEDSLLYPKTLNYQCHISGRHLPFIFPHLLCSQFYDSAWALMTSCLNMSHHLYKVKCVLMQNHYFFLSCCNFQFHSTKSLLTHIFHPFVELTDKKMLVSTSPEQWDGLTWPLTDDLLFGYLLGAWDLDLTSCCR